MDCATGPRPFIVPRGRVLVPPRHFGCPRYDGCLDFAVERGWRSWTCEHCARCPDHVELHEWDLEELRAHRRRKAG